MRLIAALTLSLLGLLSLPASADLFGRGGGGLGAGLQTPYLPAQREEPQRGDDRGLSPDEAARRAQQQNGGGRVLSVEPAGNGYRVKLLRDGEVRIVYVQ
jgi:hypothetical protein